MKELQEVVVAQAPTMLQAPNPALLPEVIEYPAEKGNVNAGYLSTLKELGFGKAVAKLNKAQKLKIAYGKYGYITVEAINAFNDKLRVETQQEDARARTYKKLQFIAPKDYGELPPPYVLDKMKEAMADGIFDRFEIAKIDWVREVKDPILFGIIESCSDKFFIAQWDDDVSIEDIILCQPR